jgi:hypothetical protein
MGFWNIILLIIKYGPAVYELIKKAIELIRWLRNNDDDQNIVSLGDDQKVATDLKEMARRCREAGNYTELYELVDRLESRKAEVEKRKQ